jgi:hypothetical protein
LVSSSYAGATAESTEAVTELQAELKSILKNESVKEKRAARTAKMEFARKVRQIVLKIKFMEEGRDLENIDVMQELERASELQEKTAIDGNALAAYRQLVQPSLKNAIPIIFEYLVEEMYSLEKVLMYHTWVTFL